MQRFECYGQLIIHINMEICKANIQVKHCLQHERPRISGGVPKEIIDEIYKNTHLDPLQLRTHFSAT